MFFAIKIKFQSYKYVCIKEQWLYPYQDEDAKTFIQSVWQEEVNLNWVKTESQLTAELLWADLSWAELVQTFFPINQWPQKKLIISTFELVEDKFERKSYFSEMNIENSKIMFKVKNKVFPPIRKNFQASIELTASFVHPVGT